MPNVVDLRKIHAVTMHGNRREDVLVWIEYQLCQTRQRMHPLSSSICDLTAGPHHTDHDVFIDDPLIRFSLSLSAVRSGEDYHFWNAGAEIGCRLL